MSARLTTLTVAVAGCGLFVSTVAAVAQTTWYVDGTNCPGPGTGTAGDPFCRIQDALDAAQDLDTIIVAPSSNSPPVPYLENLIFPARQITLRSVDPTDPATVAATVIDGGGAGTVVTFAAGTTPGAVLDGLTVRRGSATMGGGIFCSAASPTIRRCTITQNTAVRGGGIYCTASDPQVENCTISWNTSTGEETTDGGGGMANYGGSWPTLIGCTFALNFAYRNGGGVANFTDCRPTATGCVFRQNTTSPAFGQAGGVYLRDCAATITRCVFTGNTASFGGAIRALTSDLDLADCSFVANTAEGNGGAIDQGAGSFVAANCLFAGNQQLGSNGFGAGVMLHQVATLTNCVFFSNHAATTAAAGGGVGLYVNARVWISNCVIWGNTAGGLSDELAQIFFHPDVTAFTIDYSTVQGWTGVLGGVGNLGSDPRFVRPAGADGVPGTLDDDLRLRPGSPCIDAGDNDADTDASTSGVQPLPAADLAGNPRFADDPATDPDPGNPGASGPPVVDMGAYEYRWDCNSNGVPDAQDIAAGTSQDCNTNAVPDECDFADGLSGDCNNNSVPDECDVGGATSQDCTGNFTPDECEPDCNTNAIADSCDIAFGTSTDCNDNAIPDGCDVIVGTSRDCNGNGISDSCDVVVGTSPDCNGNAVPDECDVAGGTANDCNGTGVPDACELLAGTSLDCQPNGIPDECDPDCNGNSFPDDCDIDLGFSLDCQSDRVPDECQLAGNDCNNNARPDECDADCNTNGVPNACDIAGGTSDDCNTNGIPDECDSESCQALWAGFDSPPFTLGAGLHGIDSDGDGIAWDNPSGTAIAFPLGCQAGNASDNAIKLIVDQGLPAPEDGYIASERFQPLGADCDAAVYDLTLAPKIDFGLDSRWDWEFIVYDAVNSAAVVRLAFASTDSQTVGAGAGHILIRQPNTPPTTYLDTGVPLAAGTCWDVAIVLDNVQRTVSVSIDGGAVITTVPLDPAAHRMDYFRLQAVDNGSVNTSTTKFSIDAFSLCVTGCSAAPPSVYDCDGNGVLDACDISAGTSADCDGNGVPDICEPPTGGDLDGDGDVDDADFAVFHGCLTGPGGGPIGAGCVEGDFDCDDDVDLIDFGGFQRARAGSG